MTKKELTVEEKIDCLQDWCSYKIYKYLSELGLSFAHLEQIYDELIESENFYGMNFEIVDEPVGAKQNDKRLMELWVDQRTGYAGDDFYGKCYLKLPNDKYLKWHYSM